MGDKVGMAEHLAFILCCRSGTSRVERLCRSVRDVVVLIVVRILKRSAEARIAVSLSQLDS